MENKKLPLVFALTFLAVQIFSESHESPGKIVGKLPDGISEDSVLEFVGSDDGGFDFVYQACDEYFINSDGVKIGPFKKMPDIRRAGKNFAYFYSDDDEKYHFVLNGKDAAVFDSCYAFYLAPEYGKYSLIANKNEGWFIITEEKSYGPFGHRPEFFMQKKNGSVCYCVEEDGFDYVYIDGEKRGPYVFVSSPICFPVLCYEVEEFVYSWAEPDTLNYHLCVDGKDSKPYNSVKVFASGDGRIYYLAGSLDFKNTYIMCGEKILKELDASDYGTNSFSGICFEDGLEISLLGNYFSGEMIFILKDGEIVAEVKNELEAVDIDDEDFRFPMFMENWISCSKGRFGPYVFVLGMDFDKYGHALWSVQTDFDRYALYVDGRLIYESEHQIPFWNFQMDGDDFMFVTGHDFDVLNVNGKEYNFGNDIMILSPEFVSDGDFTFTMVGPYLGGTFFFHDGKIHRSSRTEKAVYYIDGNQIRKTELHGGRVD